MGVEEEYKVYRFPKLGEVTVFEIQRRRLLLRAFSMQLPATMASPSEVPVRVLIINPNTSQHMTDALKPVIDTLGFENVSFVSPVISSSS